MSKEFRACVSTVTALLYQRRPEGLRWLTFTSPEKFPGKILFPGGKRKPLFDGPVPFTDPEETLCEEVVQEVGLKINPESIQLFGIATDPARDIRKVKLSKATDGTCPAELADVSVLASFGCPDVLYIAEAIGEPVVDDREAKDVVWIDLEVKIDYKDFGAGHGIIAMLLQRWYRDGGFDADESALPAVGELDNFEQTLAQLQS